MFHFLTKNKLKILTRDSFIISVSLSLFFLLLSLSNPEQIGYSVVYKIFGISSIASLTLMFRHQLLNFLKTDLNPKTKTLLGDLSLVSLIIFAIFSWINHINPQAIPNSLKPSVLFSVLLFFLLLLTKDKIKINLNRILKYGFLISILLLFSKNITDILKIENLFLNTHDKQINLYLFLISLFFASYFVFLKKEKSFKINPKFYHIAVLLITIWGGILIFHNLGKNDIFHDETWHAQVIKSLEEGHGYKKWDFINDTPGESYRRGFFVNTAGFLMSKTFGWSEFNLRFFPALIGLSLLPIIFYIFRKFIGNLPALLTVVFLSQNINFLFLARFLRPYVTFLLFYTLSIYLSIKIFKNLFEKINLKKASLFSILFFITLICATQASQQAKILLLTIPLGFLLNILFLIKNKKIKLKKINWEKTFLFLIIFSIILTTTEILKISNFSITFIQFLNHLSLEKISKPQNEYINYVFNQNIKLYLILFFGYLLGLLILIKKIFKSQKIEQTMFLIHGTIPLLFLIFLLDRYTDFRYAYFALPFCIGISMLGFTKIFSIFIEKTNNYFSQLIIVFSLFLFIIYPVLPISKSSVLYLKSPSVWENDDGKIYLHRRAVAPEYKKAFEYIEKNKQTIDFVILGSGLNYIKEKDELNYLGFNKENVYLKNSENSLIDFSSLINDKKRIVAIVDYPHLINSKIHNYLKNNCQLASPETGIKKYAYTGSEDQNSYWPNVFICK